jgi:hypothetical protein
MEKTLFLFRRIASRDRQDFGRYYIANHAPLGKRLTRCLLGYTVNLVQSESPIDAITEHWVPRAMDLLSIEIAYDTKEDAEAVWTDDRTLFESFELYVITQEREIAGRRVESVLEEKTPGVKLVCFYPNASDAPAPPSGARRVVDNHVSHKLVFNGTGFTAQPPEFSLVRMAWFLKADAIGAAPHDALLTEEYRFIPAPAWSA